MSSAASRPPHSSGPSDATADASALKAEKAQRLRQPPSRPQLMGPPARPKPPAEPAPEAVPEPAEIAPPEPETPQLIGPISPPSERLQYRAIGLLQGKYVPSEDQFHRGGIAVKDGTLVDAVLLGRVTSLIKKYIDLACDHLWVVYPRTLYSEENVPALHVQIVGVWEPETLNADTQKPDDESDEAPRYLATAAAAADADTFSVRGEIAKYTEDEGEIVVNIVQKSKSETAKPKRPFKLLISGKLNGRATGYFWDLQVERQGGQLILKEGTQIAVVPPKRKPKVARKEGGGNRRRPPTDKPRSAGTPVPKPKPKVAAAEASSEAGVGEGNGGIGNRDS